MDDRTLDQLTRRLARSLDSRRGLIRLALGGGIAALAAGAVHGDALAACREDGQRCKQDRQCCSGRCRKPGRGRRGECRRTPDSAKGCTIRRDACAGDENQTECSPGVEGFCVVLDNGRPFCAATGVCHDCASDADCAALAGGTAGRCVTACPECAESDNRTCFFAAEV